MSTNTINYLEYIVCFAFNYPKPAEWCKYIAGNDSLLCAHYIDKWNALCNRYKYSAFAFLLFCQSLDDSASKKMFEFIKLHYKLF